MSITRDQFLWKFLKENKTPFFFESVALKNGKTFPNKQLNNGTFNDTGLISISLCPSYLNYNLKSDSEYNKHYIANKNLHGAGIIIDKNTTIEAHLTHNISSKARKNLKRYLTRLNNSFNIDYKYYYGDITKEKNSFLLAHLHKMLSKRFIDKKKENSFLLNWENNTKELFDLINKKQASFFVIYNNETPISITLNYHIKNSILFSECNGYNTDFKKFGLAHIDSYKLLDWCIKNKYQYIDLGNGLSDFKSKWSNSIYNFHYHIYYKKKSFRNRIIAYTEILKINLKNFLKKIKLDELIIKIKYLRSQKKEQSLHKNISFSIEDISLDKIDKLSKLDKIDLDEHSFLKEPIYSKLFNNKEHINSINIKKLDDSNYFVKGEKTLFKININK